MEVVFSDVQKKHFPRQFMVNGVMQPSPEVPERADVLLAGAISLGLDLVMPEDYGLEPIAAVHSPDYLQFLENIHKRWQRMPGASQQVTPNVHPARYDGGYPQSAAGQAGYHIYDTACPIAADT